MYILGYNVLTIEWYRGWRNMKKMKKYKIRKSGNSDVTTIPPEVKEFMGVQTGDAISYVFQSDGSVRMIKAQEEPDIDSLVDSIMNQYVTIEEKAAILMINLIKKHPFHNSNKRTALVAMLLFLQLNNCPVAFSRQEAVDFIIMITTSSLDFDSLKSKITNYLRQTAIK